MIRRHDSGETESCLLLFLVQIIKKALLNNEFLQKLYEGKILIFHVSILSEDTGFR